MDYLETACGLVSNDKPGHAIQRAYTICYAALLALASVVYETEAVL
jgi:hypothetical protein